MQNQSKPLEVQKALKFLYGSIALGVIRLCFSFEQTLEKLALQVPEANPAVALIIGLIFGFGFNLLLIYLIGRRKNWARHLFLILFVIGIPMAIGPLMDAFKTLPLSGVIGLAQIVIQIYGIYLLYRPISSAWFKPAPETAAPPPSVTGT